MKQENCINHSTTHPLGHENNILLLNICIFTQAAFENTYKIYAVDKNSEQVPLEEICFEYLLNLKHFTSKNKSERLNILKNVFSL